MSVEPDLATVLREMKDRAGFEAACTPAPLGSKSCDDVSVLVAAVEAVLKLADQLPPQAPPSSALEEDRMWIRQECADMIRETVTRAVLGDPHPSPVSQTGKAATCPACLWRGQHEPGCPIGDPAPSPVPRMGDKEQ